MLTLTNRDAINAALNDPDLPPCLRTLIAIRASELFAGDRTGRLHVVEGGDSQEAIKEALGFAIGEGAPDPGYETIEAFESHFEIVIRTATGVPVHVYVPNSAACEMALHAFCLAQFWPACEGGR